MSRGILKHQTVKVYADITYEIYAMTDSVPINTIEPTSITVAIGMRPIMIAICGNSKALPSFFQFICYPPDLDREGRSDTDLALNTYLTLQNINYALD